MEELNYNKKFGIILTRYITSEKTNIYWNQCIKLIRYLYGTDILIVVIDDNSDTEFVKSDYDYENIKIINSEYPKRGELLPYIYYLKYKWFDRAIIIHDATFFHKKINISSINEEVLPIWHFERDRENIDNIIRIATTLKNSIVVIHKLDMRLIPKYNSLGFIMPIDEWSGCFGCQSIINLSFLERLQRKYEITNMIDVVTCRKDRCSLERILGCLFYLESPSLIKYPSLMGNILKLNIWGTTIEEYMDDLNTKKIVKYPIMKVWSGR